ncbi:S8 family peptidase [Uliginosibacterium gangwonense]|uniref:S8 family peptidase n=1 Tax=Uliginosibacterium gangwonense TaxID=392736 RepID=UPI00039B0FFE|nr:S8 family serine peptidase [Uliginosibacterium gangwonense]
MLCKKYSLRFFAVFVGLLFSGASVVPAMAQDGARVSIQQDSVANTVSTVGRSFVDPQLLMVYQQYMNNAARGKAAKASGGGFSGPAIVNGVVSIEAMAVDAKHDSALMAELKDAGVLEIKQTGNLIVGKIDPAKIGALIKLTTARFVRAAPGHGSSIGAVTSQGDAAQKSSAVRQSMGFDGTGVTVGVTSTSYNVLGGASKDVATGDLPGAGNPYGHLTPVNVLKDKAANSGENDEGRAMLQIVHDVAPGAKLAIYAPDSIVDHAAGLRALARAGANVISDDLFWYSDPWFQESPISVAQHDILVNNNVVTVNAAANQADKSAEAKFRPLPARNLFINGSSAGRWSLHDWGNGQVTFPVVLHKGAAVTLVLQWDEPFASFSSTRTGSASDLDLIAFTDSQGSNINFFSGNRNVGADPFESVYAYLNSDASSDTFTIYVGVAMPENVGKLPGRFKIVAFSPDISYVDWPQGAAFKNSTIVGHNASEWGLTACAVRYNRVNTVFGPQPEPFSSLGGFVRTRDAAGKLLSSPLDTRKPDVCGPDGVDTTFFGEGDEEPNGKPNFYGTSAASPHLAGVAALMLQASRMRLKAGQIGSVMKSSSIDMMNSNDPQLGVGYDRKSGYGFIDAIRAVSAAQAY